MIFMMKCVPDTCIGEILPADIYLLKVNNEGIRATPLASFWCLIVNFEHISRLVLVFFC